MKEYSHDFKMELGDASFDAEEDDIFKIILRASFRYQPADPGKLYGPPETCYPPTDAEIEIFRLEVKDGQEWRDVSTWLESEALQKAVEDEVWAFINDGMYEDV